MELKPGELYRTRDGWKVRVYATDGVGPCSVHGAMAVMGGWELVSWTSDGQTGTGKESNGDIVGPWVEPELALQAGERYLTKDGHVVEIYSTDNGGTRPIQGRIMDYPRVGRNQQMAWYVDGKYFVGAAHQFDLVRRVEAEPPLKVRVGGRYLTRSGLIAKVFSDRGDADYPVLGTVGDNSGHVCWTSTGTYFREGQADWDLVKEVP